MGWLRISRDLRGSSSLSQWHFCFFSEAQDNQQWVVLSFIAFLTVDGVTKHCQYFPRYTLMRSQQMASRKFVFTSENSLVQSPCRARSRISKPSRMSEWPLRVLGWSLGNFRILWTWNSTRNIQWTNVPCFQISKENFKFSNLCDIAWLKEGLNHSYK